jgi:DNA transformation protein
MDSDAIRDLFAGLGRVGIRRLFGGKGVYFDGVIIAVEIRGELMLKGDGTLARELEAAGARRWTYVHRRSGKPVAMPYWTVPDGAADDPDEMAVWARKSYEAGLRSAKRQDEPARSPVGRRPG